jgi:DNA-binding transcriptional MerR regulator
MEYTVNKLAMLSGVSKRTLRFYDEIGLLKPARVNSSGYRIYGVNEVNQLQQILFFRALDVSLDEIKSIMLSDQFDATEALKTHRANLLSRKMQLEQLIKTVDKTIEEREGKTIMNDQEKFEGLKKQLLEENEEKYGLHIREKYGEETVEKSNKRFAEMTQETHERANRLATEIVTLLLEAMDGGDVTSNLAIQTVEKHKEWLMIYWPSYSKEAHAGLGDMYVADDRFKDYYDRHRVGAAEFLCAAIHHYTGV